MGALAAGSIIAGKYRLERPLAQGGMGSVWVAFDTRLEVRVAVKLMAPALTSSPELVGRFEREAKAAALLRSPHVVQVFEHGVDGETPFMVLELLEGEDLGTRLKQRGRLPLWEAAVVLEQVSKALRKAHEAGIVHRDLKPGNIFVARHDEDEVVKVLDFGIAKSAQAPGAEETRTGVMMGSPSYMSPEQVRSTKTVDHRSDLWSMGLVMFRVLTGKPAFTGQTDGDVMIKLCGDPVPVASEVAPDLPAAVDAFFARALQRDPELRFQSAREMAAAFSRIAGRVVSLGEAQGATEVAPVGSAPVGSAPTVELTASDGERTIPLAMAGVAEKTAPLPGATLTNAGSMAAPAASAGRGRMSWVLGAGAVVVGLAAVGLFVIRSEHGAVAVSGAPKAAATVEHAAVTATLSVTVSAPQPSLAEPSGSAPVASASANAPAASASAPIGEPSIAALATASAPRNEWPHGVGKSTATAGKPVPGAPSATAVADPGKSFEIPRGKDRNAAPGRGDLEDPGGMPEVPRVLPKK